MALKAPWLAQQFRHSDDLSPLPNALDKVRSERGRPETIPVISSRMLLLCLCVCVDACIDKKMSWVQSLDELKGTKQRMMFGLCLDHH